MFTFEIKNFAKISLLQKKLKTKDVESLTFLPVVGKRVVCSKSMHAINLDFKI